MTNIAIYPGTFDPITNGHSDLVVRAARLFDQVILAIADNTRKSTLFTTEERVELARTVLGKLDNVEVCSFSGLVTTLATQRKANIIIRGLRAVSDFDYEFQMAGMNRQLNEKVETVFMTPAENLGVISSSLVREIAILGGDAGRFVHPHVLSALNKKLSDSK